MNQDNRHKQTNKLVPGIYYDIFAMRIQGYEMKKIAEETGYTYGWIRTLFARGGVLYEYWRDWVENRKADQVERAIDMAFEHLPDVMKANIQHAMTPFEGAPMARKLIFDLTLGDLIKRADSKQVGTEVVTVAELIKKATLAKQEIEKDGQQTNDLNRNNGEVAEQPAGISQGQLA